MSELYTARITHTIVWHAEVRAKSKDEAASLFGRFMANEFEEDGFIEDRYVDDETFCLEIPE